MKKLFMIICAVSIVQIGAFLVAAQGKGQGQVPSAGVAQSHGSSADHASSKVKGDTHSEHDSNSGKQEPKDHEVLEHISRNPELNARVAKLLPPGMDLKTAAAGFKNQGQFIAALHVCKNLNIPFDQLKAKMTETHPESLGQAIHDLRPTLTGKQADVERDKAEDQARATQKNIAKQAS